MRLAITIGNSSLRAAGVTESGGWVEPRAAPWPDDLRAVTQNWLRAVGGSRCDEILLASVRPDRLAALRTTLPRDVPTRTADVDFPVPLESAYEDPSQAGLDRRLNALAAHVRHPNAHAVVFDFGTATSVSVVSPGGVFLGGVIGLGETAALDGFRLRTPELPALESSRDDDGSIETCLARSTDAAMRAGVYAQIAGGVRWIRESLARELPEPLRWIVTGGAAPRFVAAVGKDGEHVPHLTLEGLVLAADRSISSRS